MNSLRRKLLYLVLMVPTYIVVWLLSLPPRKEAAGAGRLYQLRREYQLGDSSFGEVDPTSHTLNFLLVGMRGVAANVLWQQAHDLQERHQWSELKRCVRSITLLQPRFVKVWDFQGWNLAYNVSNEWDNVEDRYYWVKEGINFMKDGFGRNPRRPELPWKIGTTYSLKIGKSDESPIYRKLFAEDTVFNPQGEDNFLVAKDYVRQALEIRDAMRFSVVDVETVGPKMTLGTSPIVFASAYPIAQSQYAEVLQKEGTFGEQSLLAWTDALQDWLDFGEQEFDAPEGVGKVKFEYTPEEWGSLPSLAKYWIERYGTTVNYQNWKTKCRWESWQDGGKMMTVEARRLTHLANTAYEEGDLIRAKELYEQSMALWRLVFDRFPEIVTLDSGFVTEYCAQIMHRYQLILVHTGELGEKDDLPADFALRDAWDRKNQIEEMIAYAEETERNRTGMGYGRGGGGGQGTGGGDSQPREQAPLPKFGAGRPTTPAPEEHDGEATPDVAPTAP